MSSAVAVVGNVNADLLVGPVRELPAWGTEHLATMFLVRTGGAAGNTMMALARLGQPCLGVGSVGDDLYGRLILDELRAAGADTQHIVVVSGSPTGIGVTVLRDDGERLFLAFLGHLLSFGDGDLERAARLWSGCRAVLLCGWNDLPSMTTSGIRRFLHRARQDGLMTLFDTGWDLNDWKTGAREIVRSLLPYVDLFLPNEPEALAIGGGKDVYEAAQALLQAGAGAVIVKRGPHGSLYVDRSRLVESPALKVKAVDTVGAGDAFNAGILYGLVHGLSPQRLLCFANAVGAHVVQRMTDRYPTEEEVMRTVSTCPQWLSAT